MCAHYETVRRTREKFREIFDVTWPAQEPKPDMWPNYEGLFIRRPPEIESGDEAVPAREAVVGRWGLVSALTKGAGLEKALKLSTFNARDDRVAASFTFSNAWRRGQHCIVPAEAIYEPDYRVGDGKKSRPARIWRSDGEPMGIAGLWDQWTDAAGVRRLSYTMLTVDACGHEVFKHYHKSAEKRQVVVLPESLYDAWLDAKPDRSKDLLMQLPADRFSALTAPPAALGPEASLL